MNPTIKSQRFARRALAVFGLVIGLAVCLLAVSLWPGSSLDSVGSEADQARTGQRSRDPRLGSLGRTAAWSGAAARMAPASTRVSTFLAEHPPTEELRVELAKLVELAHDATGEGREPFRRQLRVALLAMTPTERAAMRLQRLNIVQIARQLARTPDPS